MWLHSLLVAIQKILSIHYPYRYLQNSRSIVATNTISFHSKGTTTLRWYSTQRWKPRVAASHTNGGGIRQRHQRQQSREVVSIKLKSFGRPTAAPFETFRDQPRWRHSRPTSTAAFATCWLVSSVISRPTAVAFENDINGSIRNVRWC